LGSWYATGMMSNLPIVWGEPVAFFLIKKSCIRSLCGGYVYPEDPWVVQGLPILGNYFDYGEIDHIEDSGYLPWMKNHFQIEDLPAYLKDVERGNIEDWSFFLVHRQIYEEFAGLYHQQVLNSFQEGIQRATQEVEDREHYQKLIGGAEPHMREELRNSLLGACFLQTLSGWFDYQERGIKKYFLSSWVAGDLEDPFLKETMRLASFMMCVREMRKVITPQAGAGSQAQSYALYVKLMELMKIQIDRSTEEWEEACINW